MLPSGFDVTFRPKFPIIGANGVNLQDKWKDYPVDAYMAITVSEMPNVGFFVNQPVIFNLTMVSTIYTQYFVFYGPYGPNVSLTMVSIFSKERQTDIVNTGTWVRSSNDRCYQSRLPQDHSENTA